ncbi:3-dehydroquinate synthase [Wohlfahrtiimonas sp. G9077]|uniref:3-dehydroquinate synthase n=1 Tax=Wohlfahrtiimonas sp. G9077 TaxID=1980118 RepID=UPI000B985EB2|nr:3-dehydroquinate synthase [Wohlfahrtiimonas sp. G9077]OYQ73765.1 3-dehydroquinate synthase [Wohlfahrtiimonas sp. G9077]
MKIIDIELGDRSYPICIASTNMFTDRLEDKVRGETVLVVSNTTIAPLYMDYVVGLLPNKRVETLVLEDGEIFKNNESLQKIITKLLTLKYNRSATLIALGGGVIGDLVGFAASIYQRGIDFIQFPTSLLAQVDSSVGGKTAINHPLGKNMVGTFYQPKAVFINVDVLDTLPRREFISGLSEVIKYGLIRDRDFFYWLCEHKDAILMRDKTAIKELVARSCQNKKEIVMEDEFEQGSRALLNLGHTFGHAIEKNMGYKGILHGEAVAVGMRMAAIVSHKMGLLSAENVTKIEETLTAFLLPTSMKEQFSFEAMWEVMLLDKKNTATDIRYILLSDIGEGIVMGNVPKEYIEEAFHMTMTKDA